MTWSSAGIGSYRYGSCALWTVGDDLTGARARRLADRVDLFFRSGETALVVDMRRVGLVDTVGAAALSRCRAAHPGLRVVGPPAGWSDLTAQVRRTLLGLGSLPDLETALRAVARPPVTAELRRHPRIPLQLPVEVLVGGRRGPAALRDISRGGVLLSLIHGQCLAALQAGERFSILGMTADPLGCEIAGGPRTEPVPASPVRAAIAAGVGARFSGSPPPV